MKREEKLVKNTLILTVGTAFSSLFSFFLVPLFSKWLSASDYGTYDVYLTYVTLLIPVVTLACGEAAFRFLLDCKTDADKRKIVNCTWIIALVGTVIGIGAIAVIHFFWRMQAVIPFILLFVSFMLYNQGNFIARGLRKLSVYTISNILYLVTMAVFVTLFVFVRNMGLSGILLGNALGHFAGFAYMVFACKMWKYVSLERPEWSEFKKIANYSVPLMPNSISWWIVNVSDRTIINIILGSAANGIYAIAYKLPSLCSTVFGVFHMSWLESAVDTLNDEDRNEYTNNVFNQIVPFCFCAAACVLAINRFFYLWIWDAKYADGAVYVWILLVGMCFSFLAQFLGGILIAEKRTKANGTTTIFAAVVNIIVHIGMIHFVGLYAAAMSTACSYLSLFIVRVFLLRKSYHFSLNVKSLAAIVLFVVVVILQYQSSTYFGVFVLLTSCISSLVINRSLVVGILNKLLKRG